MDIAYLKEVIKLFTTMGIETKEIFIWWLLTDKLQSLLVCIVWAYVALRAIKCFYDIICHDFGNKNSRALRRAAGIKTNYWLDDDLDKACECLKEHYNPALNTDKKGIVLVRV